MNRPTFDELMVLINKLNKGLENTNFSSGIGGLRIHGWITSEEALTDLRKAIKSGQWGVASDEPLDGGVRDIIKHVVAILRSAERNQVGLMLKVTLVIRTCLKLASHTLKSKVLLFAE